MATRGIRTGSQRTRSEDYLVVVAIDIGNNVSGFSFSFKATKDEIKMVKSLETPLGRSPYFMPTCLLLSPDKKFKEFGYQAQETYSTLPEANNHYYFERFKMQLHQNKSLSKATLLTAANGKAIPAVDVFALLLNLMKQRALKGVNSMISWDIDPNMIRWVITVPANWGDSSELFMREAAMRGGLINDIQSTELMIALESEAASVHVLELPVEKFMKQEFTEMKDMKIKPGSRYIVIDAGELTLDVTAHELQLDGQIKMLHHGTTKDLGFTKINNEFVKLLEDIFSKVSIEIFRRDHPITWNQLMINFERYKRHFRVKVDQMTEMRIEFFSYFTEICQNKRTVEEAVNEFGNPGVRFRVNFLCLSGDVAQGLFDPVVKGIESYIAEFLNHPKVQGIKYIICVGSFTEYKLLPHLLNMAFSNHGIMLVPEEAHLSVVKGACLLGHDPRIIGK